MAILVRGRVRTVVMLALCACLFLSGFTNTRTASAMVFMSLNQKPPAVSTDTTSTFTFDGFDMDIEEEYSGDVECKIDSGAFAVCTSPFTTPVLSDGNHTFTVHAVGESAGYATVNYNWSINTAPTLSEGSNVNGVADAPIAVTDLQISDTGNDTFSVQLSAPSGMLKLNTTTGVTFAGSPTGSTITFSGTRTNLNNALATLMYTPDTDGVVTISANLTGASGGNSDTLNGHVYRVVESTTNWSTAKAAAEGSSYGGVSGYLATVTSVEERNYILDRMSDGAWVGGSDSATEGDWLWVTGPEAGTSFSSGASAVNGAYTNWQAAQPDNNGGNENCLELRFNHSEAFNDENCGSARGYMIEYGSDDALPSLDSAEVEVTAIAAGDDLDNDGIANSVEANAPNDGDANDDGIADYTQDNISSLYSSVSGKYVVTQTSCATNQQVQSGAESPAQKDSAFDYPYGLTSFTSTGCGATATVTQFYYGATDPGTLTLRKWNSTTGAYSTIDDAVVSSVTVGGVQAVKAVYQVVDGGPLDQDGVVNGTIVDPVGLGRAVVGAPNTGLKHQPTLLPWVSGILSLFGLTIFGVYTLRR